MAGGKGELMDRVRRTILVRALGIAACALAGAATAQTSDVPYVPTPWNVVEAMLGLAKVGPDDYVVDLGSGDGRIVIAAAKKHGARGFGVDIDGALVSEAQREARRQGVSDKVSFATRNLFITDISKATVITMYLFPQVNMRLRPRFLKELRPGTRIVSHEFDMDDWQPDHKVTVPVPGKPYGPPSSEVFMWIVPADASGNWRWRRQGAAHDDEVTLRQRFQILEGEGRLGGRSARVTQGRVRGEELRFALVTDSAGRAEREEFTGRVSGDAVRGTTATTGGGSAVRQEWQAVRAARGTMNVSAPAPVARHMTIAEEQR